MAGYLPCIFGFILVFLALVSSFDRRCGGKEVVYAAPSAWTVSPSYPNKYTSGLDCRWNVRAEPYERIDIRVREFLLDGRRDAKCYDFLSITDTSIAPDNPVLFSGCAQELALRSSIRSRTNEVFVTFHSDTRSGAPPDAKFALNLRATGCPLFSDLAGPVDIDIRYNNVTGLAESAVARCTRHYAFRDVTLRERGYQLLTCLGTRWNLAVPDCIAMESPSESYDVTEQGAKMMTTGAPANVTTPIPQEEGNNGGMIAGIILGLLAAVVLVVLVVFLWRKHKRGKGTPRRPPAVHNDQVYGPTTQPIETVSGKNRFGLFQKSKDKYNKDAHHDAHQAKNLLTNGKPSRNADIPGLYEEVDDNSRTQLTVNMHDHSDGEDDHHGAAVYYEADRPDVVTIETGAGDGDKIDHITTVENQHYQGP